MSTNLRMPSLAVRSVAVLTALVASFLLLGTLAPPAHAHAGLEDSDPADGATLQRLPAYAVLVFSEPVDPAGITVEVGGPELPVASAPGRPQAVQVDLRSVEPKRTVELTWLLVGSDGHEAEGSLTWQVRRHPAGGDADGGGGRGPKDDVAADAPGTSAGPPSSLVRPTEIGVRVVGYLALALLVGGLVFVSLLWPAGAEERRTRVVIIASVGAGVCAALGEGAVTLWRADGSLTLTGFLTEDFGRADAARVILWALAAVTVVGMVQGGASAVRSLAWRMGALVVGTGLVLVTTLNAHASQGLDARWGEVADFLHLVGVSTWVGGLVVLAVGLLPRGRIDELEQVVPRFSQVAMVSVLLIIASGAILVWELIWPIDGLWATHYNRVLLVKLGIFALVLTAAMASKRWVSRNVTGAAATRRRTAIRDIRTSVVAETVLVAGVLGAASVLATSSPGV